MMHFVDAAAWEAWLAGNYQADGGVWMKIAKKGSAAASVTVAQALEVALCYGWIDSHRKACDDQFFLQRYSRRRAGSAWSGKNVECVQALTAAGRMRAPGLAEVAAAQADGRWSAAYASQRNATLPQELAEALAAHPQAAARFEALDKTSRYLTMLPLLKATTPTARVAYASKAISSLLS